MLLMVLAVAAGCANHPDLAEGREITARTFRVERVIDGDTFVIHYDGEPTSVRIFGIDAPEARDPGGPEATAALREIIAGRTVRLTFPARRKRDNFGRLLAEVFLGNLNVAEAMVESKHAQPKQKGERP